MAESKPIPNGLRWFLFVVGTGALIACGVYLGRSVGEPLRVAGLLRAGMFLLLGLFCTLMYGQSGRGRG